MLRFAKKISRNFSKCVIAVMNPIVGNTSSGGTFWNLKGCPATVTMARGSDGICEVRHSPFGRYTVLSCDEVET